MEDTQKEVLGALQKDIPKTWKGLPEWEKKGFKLQAKDETARGPDHHHAPPAPIGAQGSASSSTAIVLADGAGSAGSSSDGRVDGSGEELGADGFAKGQPRRNASLRIRRVVDDRQDGLLQNLRKRWPHANEAGQISRQRPVVFTTSATAVVDGRNAPMTRLARRDCQSNDRRPSSGDHSRRLKVCSC